MATIIPNKKNGKIVSFKFRAYLGRNEFGEQITKYTTWHVPDSLTPSKAQRAAEKAASEWEKQVRAEYEQDLENPERVHEREINQARTEFACFVREVWYPICICNGEHKPTTTEFYRHISNVIADYFSGKAIQKISATDIDKFLIYLHTKCRTRQGKPLT